MNWYKLHQKIGTRFILDVTSKSVPNADVTVATAWQTAPPVAALSERKGRKFYLIQHYGIWDGREEEVNATWRLPLKKIVISKWLENLGEQLGTTDIKHIRNGIDLKAFKIVIEPSHRPMSIFNLIIKQNSKVSLMP